MSERQEILEDGETKKQTKVGEEISGGPIRVSPAIFLIRREKGSSKWEYQFV